jgi:hypothetical protein
LTVRQTFFVSEGQQFGRYISYNEPQQRTRPVPA